MNWHVFCIEGSWLGMYDTVRRLKYAINACHLFVPVRRKTSQGNIEYGGSDVTSREKDRIAPDLGTPEHRWFSRYGP